MRRYVLASPEHKQNVDLRDYEDVIVAAVMAAIKDVEEKSKKLDNGIIFNVLDVGVVQKFVLEMQ